MPALLVLLLAPLALVQMLLPNDATPPVALPVGPAPAALVPGALPPVTVPPAIDARAIFAPPRKLRDAPADPLGGYLVAGAISIGRARAAVVQSPRGGVRTVPIGGRVGGWRIDALDAAGARLSRGGARLSVAFGQRRGAPGQEAAPSEIQQ